MRDRDRRVCGVLFRDQLGKVVFLNINLRQSANDFVASFCARYRRTSSKLPWKQYEEVAAKEHLCLMGYPDSVVPPGPDFDLKKLDPVELQLLVGQYIAAVQAGARDVSGTTFYITRWSQGMLQLLL